MVDERDDGGPAFPCAGLNNLPNGQFLYGNNGMALRDAAALVALHAIISKTLTSETDTNDEAFIATANGAYAYADAMVKARQS